jgi:hypothetical protein
VRERLRDDEVRLVLPADAQYSRVARVTAAGLGMRLGLPLADIEDLRIAVDETLILLLRPDDDAGEIVFTFRIRTDRLVVDAASSPETAPGRIGDEALARFEQLVGPVVDGHEVAQDARHVRLVKLLPT